MTGPWEAKNVLFQGNTSINGPHQGGWVEGEEGECWFVHFQDLHLYGRVVHLQPMSWGNDGWPRIGEQIGNCGVGQPVLRWPRPKGLTPSPALAPQTSDYLRKANREYSGSGRLTPALSGCCQRKANFDYAASHYPKSMDRERYTGRRSCCCRNSRR